MGDAAAAVAAEEPAAAGSHFGDGMAANRRRDRHLHDETSYPGMTHRQQWRADRPFLPIK